MALLLGPWVHGVDDTASAVAGERRFADNAKIDYDGLVLDWMDHYLRGMANGVDSGNPVRYYVMGADTWRVARDWPPPALRTSFYLQQAGTGKSGLLASDRQARGFSAFVSDPAHPRTSTTTWARTTTASWPYAVTCSLSTASRSPQIPRSPAPSTRKSSSVARAATLICGCGFTTSPPTARPGTS